MAIFRWQKIENIVKTLKSAQKLRLAHSIEANWNKTALEYSRELNAWEPSKPMEVELLSAFEGELNRLEHFDHIKKEILNSIEKRRIMQTAPHLGASETPRFFCLNWLGSLGVPEKDFYVVGMFSGIPFSNKTRPGRINKKSESINLFPSTAQDALVYRSLIPTKLIESVEKLPSDFARYLPKAKVGESYTKWALATCGHIERKVMGKTNLVYIDINEVIANYLVKVLAQTTHVIYKILFDEVTREEFMKAFPNEIVFYAPIMDGKYEQMENFFFSSDTLRSRSRGISLEDPRVLIEEIKNGRLCPGLIISFLVLAFLNDFKCFGSFAQVEYLPIYQEKLAKLSFMKKFNIEKIPTSNLTTGTFPRKTDLYPVDIIFSKKKFKPNPNILFGELLLNMKKVLLESYFTGDARNNAKK